MTFTMNWLVELWNEFTDSLNTRGGTIALLFVTCVGLAIMVVHIMHHGDGGQAAATIISTFSAFTGALLLALTQKDRPASEGKPGSQTETTTATVVKTLTPDPTQTKET
jgi:sugar phosphate permease